MEECLARSQKYLEEGEEYLIKADWTQAWEKFWGAAAEMVKAAASERGWVHHSHRQLFQVITYPAQESQDGGLRRLFGLAHNFHINFYEDWLPPDQVEDGASAVRELVQKLQPMVSR